MHLRGKRQETIDMQFTPSPRYTLGVEVEFQILDCNSLNLAPLASLLLANSPPILKPRLAEELIQSVLEIRTGICFSLADVEYDLRRRSMNTTLHALEFPDIPNVLSGNSITHMAASLNRLQL